MNSKLFLMVKAVISIVIAFFVIFLPKLFFGWFSPAPLDVLGKVNAGFVGALLVGVALICYFASSATASVLRKNVILSLAVADAIGFVLALIAQLKGAMSGLGWIIVILWLVLAAGLAYFWATEKTE